MTPRGGYVASGGTLSIDFDIWDFFWRTLVFVVGSAVIIPLPWVLTWYTQWIVSRVQVPGRPNLSFTGRAMTIVPWVFGPIVVAVVASLIGLDWVQHLVTVVEVVLYWLFLKWLVANLASNGQPIGLSFSGSFWAYIGYAILAALSVIIIIGWAWVYVAWVRWFCRNIQGTRREIVFNGTGLEFLWRGIVMVVACFFIIPIPWMYRWFMQWMASQTVLAERGTVANA